MDGEGLWLSHGPIVTVGIEGGVRLVREWLYELEHSTCMRER